MPPPIALAGAQYKEFPPRWRNQKIPTSSRAAALAGLSTYTAIRPLGIIVRDLTWAAVSIFGPRILPSKSGPLGDTATVATFADLFEMLYTNVVPFDEVSVHRQRGEDRIGSALLLIRRGAPCAFVKFRRTDQADALHRERDAIEAITAFRPRQFQLAGVMGFGEHRGWSFLALEPLAPGRNRTPSRPSIADICSEITAGLGNISRPIETPSHWTPMHGDFTPWNLREIGKRLTLFDWEHASWGPPGSDAALYYLTSRVLHLRTTPTVDVSEETRSFWLSQGRIET